MVRGFDSNAKCKSHHYKSDCKIFQDNHLRTSSERPDMVGCGMNINKVDGNLTPPSL